MTIEEKAKAYDESIERAKVFKKHLLEIDEKDYADEIDYIFPKLAESEDEKVKKSLIRLVKAFYDVNFPTPEGFTKEQLLSWLEKQSIDISSFSNEQQKYIEKYISLDKVTLIKLLAERDRNVEEITESFEKQSKQKPNPCENCGIATNNCQKFPCVIRDDEQKPANWLQELEDKLANATPEQFAKWKEKYFKEEPAEWGEEDEKMFKTIANSLDRGLVERVWHTTIKEVIAWLKFLKDRYTWKPSDKQMDALHYVTNFDYGGHKATLVSLYEQLKKLRKE